MRPSAKYNVTDAQFVPSDRDIEPIRFFYLGLGLDRLILDVTSLEMQVDRIPSGLPLILARTALAALADARRDCRARPDLTDSIDLAHCPSGPVRRPPNA